MLKAMTEIFFRRLFTIEILYFLEPPVRIELTTYRIEILRPPR